MMKTGIKNDLNIELVVDEIEIEVRFRDVAWVKALEILNEYQNDEIKSFTWE
jgi:hypothetical protein